MDILKIPTDNLYKFLAVSGLIGFLGCAYLAFFERQSMDLLWMDYLTKAKSIDLRIADSQENKESRITFIFYMINSGKKEEARKLMQENQEKEKMFKQADYEKALQEPYFIFLKKRMAWTGYIVTTLWIGSVSGLIFSVVGFLGWYFKVQRHLDAKMNCKA